MSTTGQPTRGTRRPIVLPLAVATLHADIPEEMTLADYRRALAAARPPRRRRWLRGG